MSGLLKLGNHMNLNEAINDDRLDEGVINPFTIGVATGLLAAWAPSIVYSFHKWLEKKKLAKKVVKASTQNKKSL